MATIRVLYAHSMMFHGHAWQQAAELLSSSNITLTFAPQKKCASFIDSFQPDIFIIEFSTGSSANDDILTIGPQIQHCLALTTDAPSTLTTFDEETVIEFRSYIEKLSPTNYANGVKLLANRTGFPVEVLGKERVQTCGIYHPLTETHFENVEKYFSWRKQEGKLLQKPTALLFYYGQLIENNLAEIDSLIIECEQCGLCPIPIFTAGIEVSNNLPDYYELLTTIDMLGVVVSCMAGRLLRSQIDSQLFEKLNVPIIQTLRSHGQTEEEWFENPQGLSHMSAVFSQTYPEMFGAIRPSMIAALDKHPIEGTTWIREYQAIPERVSALTAKLVRHFQLVDKNPSDKKLTIVLHNNPCKGVEATIGMAVGLDTFSSLVLVLKKLKQAGYDIGDCPLDGKALLQEILDKKAISEFRWTTVDEIVEKGGALHMMDKEEYLEWFEQQNNEVRAKILDDWGPFPGEGMAWQAEGNDVLVITGLTYGNVQIINQPKRGCYGAKCNGEVCRILHDPNISPPHHWFATYKYIRDTSDAVIHFGTEGSLEYLPGKQNGLSGICFPEITLAGLPNFYIYVMDATGEGLIAKRRGQATLVDHLGPVHSTAQLNEPLIKLASVLEQHSAAVSTGETTRVAVLQDQLLPLMKELHLIDDLDNDITPQQCDLARRRIAAIERSLSPEGLHVLGEAPTGQSLGKLLATMLRKSGDELPTTNELGSSLYGDDTNYNKAAKLLEQITTGSEVDVNITPPLKRFCLDVKGRLTQTHQELDNLLTALAGEYVPPGLSGSLSSGRVELIPTGRNFYAKDVSLLPTRAAFHVGDKMAVELLQKYLQEEKKFPERVGLSIWSSDAFKSDGELFCKILTLLGVRPRWNRQDKVQDLEVIPLEELTIEVQGEIQQRPRIDVTIETSGIMRDMVPNFVKMLDEAVLLVNDLTEPHEWNYIKKHTHEIVEELRQDTKSQLTNSQMQRMASFRVFSSAPGTYGLGVGLALDASAWTTDKELAEIYINSAGYAYGSDDSHTVAQDVLTRQLSGLDIAYMKQTSEEYDILDCGCYSVSQGSMATATRALSGKDVKLYWTEAGGDRELTDVKEQLQRSTEARLLNTHWINSMKQHGYQGVMAVSSKVNNLFKWSATGHVVSKDLFDRVVSTYIQDEENRKWIMNNNPYAMEEITRRLLEAESRNLWEADQEALQQVQYMALEIEGEMEEIMGEVNQEFQGGKVEVLGKNNVDTWKHEWRIDND